MESTVDKCLEYTIKHKLYKTAMGIYHGDDVNYKKVLKLYGDYMMEYSEFHEAGICKFI